MNLNCRLLCASQAAYAIGWDQVSGATEPQNIGDINYSQQYKALNVQGSPYIAVQGKKNAALIVRTPTEIILAYRGTVFNSPTDWINDLLVEQVPCPVPNTGKVHDGFLGSTTALGPAVNNALQALTAEAPTLPIFITGHSKGGGMAPIAAIYMAANYGFSFENVVTFAGPSPGDNDFATVFNKTYPNTESYQNYLDIVPLLPPSRWEAAEMAVIQDFPVALRIAIGAEAAIWDYIGVGTVKYIDESGNVVPQNQIPFLYTRLAAIAAALKVDYSTVLNAHHAGCGFRYMEGTCQGAVCLINPH